MVDDTYNIDAQFDCPACHETVFPSVEVKVEPVIGGAATHYVLIRGATPHECKGGDDDS